MSNYYLWYHDGQRSYQRCSSCSWFPFEDSNALTNLIPEQLKITLKEALEQEPKLKELIANNANVAKLFDLAQRLEGITRHASKHAAGIVISPEPISDVLPVYIPPKSTDLVTQYAMTELESLGFLKMDFLGLKNLTLIDYVVKLIKQNRHIELDITKLPLDDAKTFALLGRGETSGVFQLESDGLKDVLRRLQPAAFEDIIAVNALYRPGPLGSGMVDDFIERKHGRQPIVYIFTELEPSTQRNLWCYCVSRTSYENCFMLLLAIPSVKPISYAVLWGRKKQRLWPNKKQFLLKNRSSVILMQKRPESFLILWPILLVMGLINRTQLLMLSLLIKQPI